MVQFPVEFSKAELKGTEAVSFDPLSLIAILWNPRASASAARLYSQQHGSFFRWPHMMQIGAVTVPVSVLVGHLTSNLRSIHPSVEMFLADVNRIKVKSSIGGSVNLFTSLPVSKSESVLKEALEFKPSNFPTNDLLVVALGPVIDRGRGLRRGEEEEGGSCGTLTTTADKTGSVVGAAAKLVSALTEICMGLMITCGLVFSILMKEVWAMGLFNAYLVHWAASTWLVSLPMIVPDPKLSIVEDSKHVYAVYERPSGGWVVFKGTQKTMEQWARTSWIFNDTPFHRAAHWVWIVTGALAALASVATLVNMDGRLQLGFLGMLLYGSAAEIWLTALYQKAQPGEISYLGSCDLRVMHQKSSLASGADDSDGNDKKYKSIIQAGVGENKKYRLEGISWTGLGLLPPRPPFTTLEQSMDKLNKSAMEAGNETGDAPKMEHLEEAQKWYEHECQKENVLDGFARTMAQELTRTWELRVQTYVSSCGGMGGEVTEATEVVEVSEVKVDQQVDAEGGRT